MIKFFTLLWAAALISFSSIIFAQGTAMDISTYRFLEKAKFIGESINKDDYAAIEREFDPQLQFQLPYSKLKPLMENLIRGVGRVKLMGTPKLQWKDVAV